MDEKHLLLQYEPASPTVCLKINHVCENLRNSSHGLGIIKAWQLASLCLLVLLKIKNKINRLLQGL